ncbi:hypothetical protein DLAC_06491 [Tieghemostelium lacteum]|uniref:Uncharacterized protein n=1 Tax=Tieghemostelium lacteum TaxID=361077 RepID=A0A151ZEW7_TIELA|nr:hypothetical protein DLAC_06491 [Tieghemostelium lacteum]|eukprot:KYQ92501.1 hypothetical protein DLAC_06491 [Tieghemostelium lacteum]
MEENNINKNLEELVEFLNPLHNETSEERYQVLSNLSPTELQTQLKKLGDIAYIIGLEEQKQLQIGQLLGILSER